MDWPLFLSTFALIFLAELPDKTAFATLLLASRGRAVPIFLGVAVAFLVQSALAVALGGAIGHLPERAVHLASAFLFLGFGLLEWRKSLSAEEEEEERAVFSRSMQGFLRTAATSFVVIFLAEWGDLTQLATATLAARTRSPFTIFLSATAALWCVTLLAISVGKLLGRFLHEKHLQKIAAVVFTLIGLWFLAREFF